MKKSKGDVQWFVPGKKKPIAHSTKAASDLIVIMSQEYDTIQQVHDAINYDVESKEILQEYIFAGYGSTIAKQIFPIERMRNI